MFYLHDLYNILHEISRGIIIVTSTGQLKYALPPPSQNGVPIESPDQLSYFPSKRQTSRKFLWLSQSAVSDGDRKPWIRGSWAANHHCPATGRFWPQSSAAQMRYSTAPGCWYPNSGFWRRLIALEGKKKNITV